MPPAWLLVCSIDAEGDAPFAESILKAKTGMRAGLVSNRDSA